MYHSQIMKHFPTAWERVKNVNESVTFGVTVAVSKI